VIIKTPLKKRFQNIKLRHVKNALENFNPKERERTWNVRENDEKTNFTTLSVRFLKLQICIIQVLKCPQNKILIIRHTSLTGTS
jgi:hypothetical protein